MLAPKISYYELSIAVGVFAGVFVGLLLLKTFLTRQLCRAPKNGRLSVLTYVEQVIRATRYTFMLIIAVLAAVSQLDLAPLYRKWLNYAWIVILIVQLALWANRIIKVAVERAIDENRLKNPASATHLMILSLVGRIMLWSVALLMMLDNLGFNITTLMASLGIGGIAVSLALQNILGDIFSSISIALDKPFSIGDFIIVDNYMGTVEYVGLKTTRIRSLGGEQIVFSNGELLKNRIRNYQLMRERRIQFNFGISYETELQNVKRVSEVVKDIIRSYPNDMRLDRVNFKQFGESALEYEVVYFMLTADFNRYMDLQEEINLRMMQRFREMDIHFAHPARQIYMPAQPGREQREPYEEAFQQRVPARH